MPGDLRGNSKGQLAFMDAMVFFAIAMLLSGALLAQVRSASDEYSVVVGGAEVDAANMLEVLMAVSIGQTLAITLEKTIVIASHEQVSECLRAELHALASGAEPEAFDALNEAVAEALRALAGPCMRASLVASFGEGSSDEPLLEIPGRCHPAGLAYASSVDLPCGDGVVFKILLVLEPASSPKLV